MFLKSFSRLSSVTSYFYLVYSLSSAFIALCVSDFHNVVACCVEKKSLLYFKPSLRYCGCASLCARVWEVANTLCLCGIVSYPSTLCHWYFFSRYKNYSLSSFSLYGSLCGPLTWVLPFSELKPFLSSPLLLWKWDEPSCLQHSRCLCLIDFFCYIKVFFLFCSQLFLKFLALYMFFCLLLNIELMFQRGSHKDHRSFYGVQILI